MRFPQQMASLLLAALAIFSHAGADDTTTGANGIRTAIEKAVPLLQEGSRGSAEQRQCFTCHNQAVPVFALAELRERSFAIDNENFQRQLRHTAEHLERGRKNYAAGRGQGGKVLTAGYALWTLEVGGRTPDATTDAVAEFLLNYQQNQPHWSHPGSRPPSSGSHFTATYVALRGLEAFGTDQQQSRIAARRNQIRDWLLSENPSDTEDRVFRLWALPYVDADDDAFKAAAAALIESQRDDGGWSQTAEMESDAYATATAIVALLKTGAVPADHAAVKRGIDYLLRTQLPDGSWHVTTRAKPFQTYFESGFPHGKDQFLSIAASSWATLALALTLPAPN